MATIFYISNGYLNFADAVLCLRRFCIDRCCEARNYRIARADRSAASARVVQRRRPLGIVGETAFASEHNTIKWESEGHVALSAGRSDAKKNQSRRKPVRQGNVPCRNKNPVMS